MKEDVFKELMNRGVITHVGLYHENYDDLKDLQTKQIATTIGSKKIYDELTNDNIETPEISEEPVEEPKSDEISSEE